MLRLTTSKLRASLLAFAGLSLVFLWSCGDDEPGTDEVLPIASFQFAVDETNFLQVTFSNFSQNATSYSWDFGDGNSSTEEAPVHTYEMTGDYTVTLTATDDAGEESMQSQSISITDPDEALTLLAGSSSKTWKLLRDGTSMLLAADPQYSQIYWTGTSNDGQRPCLYDDEFTFGRDGSYTYNDAGTFWAEFGIFNNVADCDTNVTGESCFEVSAATMVNACGDDISAWGSGTHSYTYDASTGKIDLSGTGAWIGIPKLGTTADNNIVPQSAVQFDAVLVDGGESGVDTLFASFTYAGTFWPITYVSYDDASLEPALVTEFVPPACEPLAATSPTEISHTFASNEADQWTLLQPITSGATLTLGVDDPTDAAATKVGQYTRNEGVEFQELQFALDPSNAINFENLSTITMDVYMPSSNDYSGALTDNVFVGFGATTCPPNWWEDQHEYQELEVAKDQWVTITFDLTAPAYVAVPDNGATVKDRNDMDMIYIAIGGGGHTVGGEFYIRNFSIQ